MDNTLGSKILFENFCKMLEIMTDSKKDTEKRFDSWQSFIKHCRKCAKASKLENPDFDVSLFPVFRLIFPKYDHERKAYKLGEKSLSNIYLKVFGLSSKIYKDKLLNYKSNKSNNATNDFAHSVYYTVKPRLPKEYSKLTLKDINKFLDSVAATNTSNLVPHFNFMNKISANEVKWLTRLILKELHISLQRATVFKVLHEDADTAFTNLRDLRVICDKFTDYHQESNSNPNSQNTIDHGIKLFYHFTPMLLERLEISQINELFIENNETYYLQTKFDGERSQMHMKDGIFKYITRNGFDITDEPGYGKSIEYGFLTKQVAPQINKNCHSFILDGELMLWDKKYKVFGQKSQHSDVKKISENNYYQPCFVAYDIIMYNDEFLVDSPYSRRLNILKDVFTDKKGFFIHCPTSLISTKKEVIKVFHQAINDAEEGIVLKKSDCLYQPGVRNNSGCYKIKPDYSEKLVNDLDVIILGGCYGSGKFTGSIGKFIVGLAGPNENNKVPTEFKSVAVAHSGLSDDKIKKLQERLKPHWVHKKPKGVEVLKRHHPDVWVNPKNSVILTMRATEVVKSLGEEWFYLQFPRVEELRFDKPWYDTCKLTVLSSLTSNKRNNVVKKLTKKNLTVEDIERLAESDTEYVPRKARKRKSSAKAQIEVDSNYTKKYIVIDHITRLFEGKKFCVRNGSEELSVDKINQIILEHSGTIDLHPEKDTFCVLVGKRDHLKAANVINANKYDVASLDWLKRATAIENWGKLVDFYPWELYSASSSTKKRFEEEYDCFLDSYTEDADEQSLERTFSKVEELQSDSEEITSEEIKRLNKRLFNDSVSPYSVFYEINGYFHNNNDDVSKYLFSFMSGNIITEFDEKIVHYVFVKDDDDKISLENLSCYKINNNESEESDQDSVIILKSLWISDCYDNQKLLPIENYIIK